MLKRDRIYAYSAIAGNLSRITLSKHGKIGPKRIQRRDATFLAFDRFGHRHQIDVFTEILAGQADGAQTLVTEEGESVDRISKGLYRIVQGSVDLVSNDLAAP